MQIVTVVNCPLCHSTEHKIYAVLDHRELRICFECKHLFVGKFDKQRMQKVYNEEYHGSEKDMVDWNLRNNNVWEGLCRNIKKYLEGKGVRLLDMGAGTGGFALKIKERYPEVALTLIENSYFAKIFLKNNIKDAAIYGDLFELESAMDSGKFDVITILQTLEHLENPKEICENLYGILKNGGILLLTVPNRKSYKVLFNGINDGLCFSNQTHIHFFDRAGMKKMLLDCGFSKVKRVVQLGGSNHDRLMSFFQWILRLLGFSTENRFVAIK